VVIEGSYLLAGVRDQPPLIKVSELVVCHLCRTETRQGRLYGNIESTSSWQLESRKSRLSARERTTSTTSTTSTGSSYAFVSDLDISSSFAASLESGQVSDAEDLSSALSSPVPMDFPILHPRHMRAQSNVASPRSGSPGAALRSMASSYSSIESLHSLHSGRLLTLHLEKEHSAIWPSLIVGPVPESMSPFVSDPLLYHASHELEHQYNMDPTSLLLLALELFDIRNDKEEAFECFMWVLLLCLYFIHSAASCQTIMETRSLALCNHEAYQGLLSRSNLL
jgi:hypothetical protein